MLWLSYNTTSTCISLQKVVRLRSTSKTDCRTLITCQFRRRKCPESGCADVVDAAPIFWIRTLTVSFCSCRAISSVFIFMGFVVFGRSTRGLTANRRPVAAIKWSGNGPLCPRAAAAAAARWLKRRRQGRMPAITSHVTESHQVDDAALATAAADNGNFRASGLATWATSLGL